MVVAANSRAQTNQRTLELSGAEVVRPGCERLVVLLDIIQKLRRQFERAFRPAPAVDRFKAWVASGNSLAGWIRLNAAKQPLETPSAWYSSGAEMTIGSEAAADGGQLLPG
jgi:hypothetical protein